MKRVLKFLLVLALVALVVFGVLVFGAKLYFESTYLEPALESHASAAEAAWPAIENDIAELGKRAPFSRVPTHERDAAVVLNARLGWRGTEFKSNLPELPKALTELTDAKSIDRPLTDDERAALESLDTRWLSELSAFDHWSLMGAGPLKTTGFNQQAPAPNYVLLVHWSRLWIHKARAAGRLAEIEPELHHVVRLLWTNETLISSQIANAILGTFAKAYPDAAFKLEDVERLKRVTRSTSGAFTAVSGDDFRQRFTTASKKNFPLLYCVGVNDAVFWVMGRPHFDARAAGFFAALDEAGSTEKSCRLELLKNVQAQVKDDPFALSPSEDRWSRLPIVRSLVGTVLLSMALPNAFGGYE